jgi:hypothetical protein
VSLVDYGEQEIIFQEDFEKFSSYVTPNFSNLFGIFWINFS